MTARGSKIPGFHVRRLKPNGTEEDGLMETTNTHRSISRTLAVIDGGSNFKATVQTQPAIHKPKLLDQVRQAIRTRHYSYMTEKAYVHWIKRFIFFHNKRHPAEMREREIGHFFI
jgi:hypothetical protein